MTGATYHLSGSNELEILLNQSVEYLAKAKASQGDFSKQIALAEKAATGFEQLQADSLFLEAKFLVARGVLYGRDSLGFLKEIVPIIKIAETLRDTNALVRAYNMKGSFYFMQGNPTLGIKYFKTPDQLNYYSKNAQKENIYNLGALIDIGLGYTMDLDSVYHYVNRLQALAVKYGDPTVQIVSSFKRAQLIQRTRNYEEALTTLQAAYPFLSKVEDKGFLRVFYTTLVNNFIEVEQFDSAQYYLKILQDEVAYSVTDPRRCILYTAKTKADIMINVLEERSEEFMICYNETLEKLNKTGKASANYLTLLHVNILFLHQQKNWEALDVELALLDKYASLSKSNHFLAQAHKIKYESLKERGDIEGAFESLIAFKAYDDKINQYIFSQSESMLKNKWSLELAEQENKVLQVENLNQKLLLSRDKNYLLLSVLGVLFMGLLVTYYIHLSRERGKRSQELSRLVKERTLQLETVNDALTKTNQELVEKNAELARFTFIASHDLKTPLSNIVNFAGLLKQKLAISNDKEVKEYLGFIIRGGKRMNSLIEDVLEYSGLAKKQPVARIINLNHLVREVKKSLSKELAEKNATIECQSNLNGIKANPAKIILLFKNLIENGITYNNSKTPFVKIYDKQDVDYYHLFFEDNGIGISKDFYPKIFQMFTRLHNHSEYEGSGLGLATCKKIVEEMGGTIDVESHLEGKSIFSVSIPTELLITKEEERSLLNPKLTELVL